MSYQAKKQYKERPKQYTYKPMTDQEILDARRKIGLQNSNLIKKVILDYNTFKVHTK